MKKFRTILNDKTTIKNTFKNSYVFIVLAFIYIPLIFIVLISLNGQTPRGNVDVNFGSHDFSFTNYLKLWSNNDFINGLLNSALLSLIVVPVTLFIGIFTCLGMWRKKGKISQTILRTSSASLAIPDPITGISLALLFTSTFVAMGFDLGYATVCMAHISFCVPYAIITIYPRIAKMNPNLILASYDLGQSKIRTFFKVTLPYLTPGILSALAIVVLMSFDDFVITNLVNGSFTTIGTAIYSTRKGIKAWVVTFGAIIVLISFLIVLIMIFVKKNKKGTK